MIEITDIINKPLWTLYFIHYFFLQHLYIWNKYKNKLV